MSPGQPADPPMSEVNAELRSPGPALQQAEAAARLTAAAPQAEAAARLIAAVPPAEAAVQSAGAVPPAGAAAEVLHVTETTDITFFNSIVNLMQKNHF